MSCIKKEFFAFDLNFSLPRTAMEEKTFWSQRIAIFANVSQILIPRSPLARVEGPFATRDRDRDRGRVKYRTYVECFALKRSREIGVFRHATHTSIGKYHPWDLGGERGISESSASRRIDSVESRKIAFRGRKIPSRKILSLRQRSRTRRSTRKETYSDLTRTLFVRWNRYKLMERRKILFVVTSSDEKVQRGETSLWSLGVKIAFSQ